MTICRQAARTQCRKQRRSYDLCVRLAQKPGRMHRALSRAHSAARNGANISLETDAGSANIPALKEDSDAYFIEVDR
jgi:hypothetical protein